MVRLHGTKETRASVISDELVRGSFDVCITTYETLAQESTALRKLQWGYLVVDEAHRLKNEASLSLCFGPHMPTSLFRPACFAGPVSPSLFRPACFAPPVSPSLFRPACFPQPACFAQPVLPTHRPIPSSHLYQNSKLSTVARSMRVSRRLLLTGTPIQNNLHELYALLNFLYPEIFTSSAPFDTAFDSKAGMMQNETLTRLQGLLQGCLLRRLKTEVEKGLPPKTETKLFLPLSKMQSEWYRKILLRDLGSIGGGAQKGARVQNIVIHLRKV